MQSLFAHVDLYCERVAIGLWAEPLNLLSNMAFVWVASLFFLRQRKHKITADKRIVFLMSLIGLVGVGSALFHSIATVWAQIFDVLFIGLYVLFFLMYWLEDILSWSKAARFGAVLSLLGLSVLISHLAKHLPLNHSESYFGIALALAGLGMGRLFQRQPFVLLLMAACLFALALSFRILDHHLCADWRFGTHFLWHMTCALVCYFTLRAYVEAKFRLSFEKH